MVVGSKFPGKEMLMYLPKMRGKASKIYGVINPGNADQNNP